MKTYTTREAAEVLRVKRRTVTAWIRQGKLGAFRMGRLWRVTEKDLERFIEERRTHRVEKLP